MRNEKRRVMQNYKPESQLRDCTNLIKGPDYPVEHLQVPLASLTQIELRK